jgi:hypothetical protein
LLAGPHAITVVYTSDSPNFAGSSTPSQFGQSVDRAPLTITAYSKSKVYGSPNPAFTATYAGFVLGQGPNVLGGTLAFTAAATVASHVGSYPITPGGLTATNYAISFVAGSLAVTPAPLTITAEDKTKVYGAAAPVLTANYAGFVNGDTPSNLTASPALSTNATAASHVGTYPITTAGAASADYAISYSSGLLTVITAVLTVTADDKTRLYGQPNPALTASTSGFVNGDTTAVITGAPDLSTVATIVSSVGTYAIAVSIGTLTAADYSFVAVGGTLIVGKAHLTVTADNKTKVYGSPNPTLTYTVSGFVNGQALATSGVTGSAALSTSATTTSPVGTYPIMVALGSLAAANYDFPTLVPGTLSITYGVQALIDQSQPHNSGSSIPIKLRLTNAAGGNLSSAATAVSGLSLQTAGGAILPLSSVGNANPGNLFRYDADLGGYIFNLDTTGLGPGTYTLWFTVAGDPVRHSVTFVIR